MPLFLAQTGDRTSRGSAAAIPGLLDRCSKTYALTENAIYVVVDLYTKTHLFYKIAR